MSTILFTHNDLDALGCILSIKSKVELDKIFYTNYGNIAEVTDAILDYISNNPTQNIIIADVCFSNHSNLLDKLYSKFTESGKMIYIDHHLYPDNFFDKYPKMFVKYNRNYSAAKLCFNNFRYDFDDNATLKNLESIINIIDVYDVWRSDNRLFNFAVDFNEYFWLYKIERKDIGESSIEEFADSLKKSNYKFPRSIKNDLKRIHDAERDEYVKSRQDGMLKRSSSGAKISLIFGGDFFNYKLVQEMDAGQDFVIGILPNGVFKVRIRGDSGYCEEFKESLRKELMGDSNIGHNNAFTYKIADNSLDSIIKECQRLSTAINSIPNF